MRDEILEPAKWKGTNPQTESRNQCRTSRRQQPKTHSEGPRGLSVAALDAAFEDVDLSCPIPQPHRVDCGTSLGDPREDFVERLASQLSALEAHCQRLQGLLSSARRMDN